MNQKRIETMKRSFLLLVLNIAVGVMLLVPQELRGIPLYGLAGRLHDWKDFGCRMTPGPAGGPPSGANNAGGNAAYCSTCQSSGGIPRWWIDDPWENLWISDEPLSYIMSSGQKMSFRFMYRQRYKVPEIDEVANLYNMPQYRRDQERNPYFNYMRTFGMTNASWSHSWMMNIMFWDRTWETNGNAGTIYSHQYEALVFRPEGGIQYFYNPTPTLAPTPPDGISQVSLQALSGLGYPVTQSPSSDTNNIYWGDPGAGFKLVYPDGSQDVFGICYLMDNNPVDSNSTALALLTQRIDPAGRTNWIGYENTWMTNCNYHSAPLRVRYVVDFDGRTNTFRYNTNVCNAWELREIDDPYGRKALFSYSGGVLASIVDAASNTNSFAYLGNGSGWITNLMTPYGTISFSFYENPDTNHFDSFFERATYVQEPEGAHQLYYFANQYSGLSNNLAAPSVPGITDFDNGSSGTYSNYTLDYRNTLHWDRRQFTTLSSTVTNYLENAVYGVRLSNAVYSLSGTDMKTASLKHWLLGQDGVSVTESLSSERDPSPDAGGAIEGQRVWYNYPGKPSPELAGDAPISCIARLLPDTTSQYARYLYMSGSAPLGGLVYENHLSYSLSNGTLGEFTNDFYYSYDGLDLWSFDNSAGQYGYFFYNSSHQVTNAFGPGWTMTLNWEPYTHNLVGVTLPNGQSLGISLYSPYWTTNFYVVPTNVNFAQSITLQPEARFIGISNYIAGLPSVMHATGTNLPDLWLTNSWDSLNRLVTTAFTDGTTVSNLYTALHLTGHKDRLGHWNWLGYDGLEHLTSITDAKSNTTHLGWCNCGSLASISDPLSGLMQFFYNNQELLTNIVFADLSSATNYYDNIGRLTASKDGASRLLNYGYNNRGLVTTVSNVYGQVLRVLYDGMNRPVTITDANGVTVTNQFDLMNRLIARTWQDGLGDRFGYGTNGLAAYTNRSGKITRFSRDAAGRLAWITNANLEVNGLAYNALDEVTDLWDGRTNHTTFQYNQYGWLISKTNALTNGVFVYSRDANGQVTTNWTPQFGNTVYAYDPVGNITNIAYANPSTHSVTYTYDPLNRLTTMVDGAGTNNFTYTAIGQLQTDDGPWANDTVTSTYAQQLRQTLSLAQPTGAPWSQTYGYDSSWRLSSLVSPAGVFGYGYSPSASALVQTIALPNGASETNHHDSLSRVDFTALLDHWGHILDGYGYTHDPLGLRTNIDRYLGMTTNKVVVGYDNIGQITSWSATETNAGALITRQNEQFGWTYDKSGNLQSRTSGSLVQTFTNDAANELTGISRNTVLTVSGNTPGPSTNLTVNGQAAALYGDMTFAAVGLGLNNGANNFTNIAKNRYGVSATNLAIVNLPSAISIASDLNGNLINDGTHFFVYDPDNRLVTNYVTNQWKTEFVYDGLGRRRIERDYGWAGGWGTPTNELHFIYDGLLLIQIRDANNNVLVTYSRGLDLSGTIAGAGGIGGLLARTDNTTTNTSFYHADGAGNITALMDYSQLINARYLYNPFGRLTAQWGPLAAGNEMQFSSMPRHAASGLSLFAFRAYDQTLQRWTTQDPIGPAGGLSLYRFVGNDSINNIDPFGLFVNVENSLVNPKGPNASDLLDPKVAKQLTPGELAMPIVAYAAIAATVTGVGALVDAYGSSVMGWLGLGGAAAESPPGQEALRDAQRLLSLLQQACVRGKDYLDRAYDTGKRLVALINQTTGETAFGETHVDAFMQMDTSFTQVSMIHAEYTPGLGWEIYQTMEGITPEVENALKNYLNSFLP